LPAGATHCGACIPCYVRRIAIEHDSTDQTAYARDVWSDDVQNLPPEDDGRRNLADLTEFVVRFLGSTNEELMSEFPELFSENFDTAAVMDMYRRFADEARTVLSRYANVAPFLT
jgi:hypothetical protein